MKKKQHPITRKKTKALVQWFNFTFHSRTWRGKKRMGVGNWVNK